MLEQLNHIESDVAKEIINIGLSKAADSLSFFAKQKVIVRSSELLLKKTDHISNLSAKKGEKIHLLTTEIIGDLTGVCYLIFNEQEVDELLKISLPASVLNDEAQKKEMSEAILKEADNIISASVITQFSNLLDINMYGGVPHLDIMAHDDIMSFLKSNSSKSEYLLQINAQFHTEDVDFSPDFIWFLDNKFIEGIKEFVKNEPNLEKLKKIKNN